MVSNYHKFEENLYKSSFDKNNEDKENNSNIEEIPMVWLPLNKVLASLLGSFFCSPAIFI